MFKETFFEEKRIRLETPEEKPIEKSEKEAMAKTENKKEVGDKDKISEEFNKSEAEMKEKEKEVRAEIEAKFRKALESLHKEIQSAQESAKEFPSQKELRELIEEIPLFAQMQEGAKNMFVGVLATHKEFRSPDSQVFVNHGMDALKLFIELAIVKEGGNLWLQERAEKIGTEVEKPQTEKTPKEIG